MLRTVVITLAALTVWQPLVQADEQVDQELRNDVVLRAMVDELGRSMNGLELKDLERPYFIEYAISDTAGASVSAAYGSVTSDDDSRRRLFRSDVRVGSYDLDNTNFSGGGGWWGGSSGAAMPVEDDYTAIRQAIWWITDADYKQVSEDLVRKKAFMESKMIEDKPADMSQEKPAVYFEKRDDLKIERGRLREMAVALSKIFRDYPEIHESSASASASHANRYMVNSEGTRMRSGSRGYVVSVNASVQAEDGMVLSDSVSFKGQTIDDLPSLDKMSADTRVMIARLTELKKASTLESYTGPVLFDAESAAPLFAAQFSRRFSGGQRDVGSQTPPDDFSRKLNRRILPRSVSVVDDPTITKIGDDPVFGHYLYDDQGVSAQPVKLVEGGRLLAQLMSRNPSKEFAHSNGHGRGMYQPQPTYSNLVLTAEDGLSTNGLKQELIDAAQDEGLEYGIRVAELGSVGGGGGGSASYRYRYGGRGGAGGSQPLIMYKVFPDGHEELVRGADISGLNLKAFKRLLALGDKPYLVNSAGGAGGGGSTVAAPAMLFEELDLAEIDRDFDKPPILPSPLAREQESTK